MAPISDISASLNHDPAGFQARAALGAARRAVPWLAGLGWERAAVCVRTAADFLGLLLRVRLSDVSDMDLSGACFPDVDMLAGVTWTDDTSWPPHVIGWVRGQSTEICPGVYLVRDDGRWGPSANRADA
jgi:hypothetical protein